MPFSEHRCLSDHCCTEREMIHPWFLLVPFIVSGIRWAAISVSVTEHLSTVGRVLQIVATVGELWKGIKNLGDDSFHKGFYLCHLDEGRLHVLQNGLLFCQRQMSVKSSMGMIECVLQQQAACAPCGCWKVEGEGDFKGRKSFNSDSTLFLKPHSLFTVFTTATTVVYLIVWPQVIHSLY